MEGNKSLVTDQLNRRVKELRRSYINNPNGTKSIVGKGTDDQGDLEILCYQDQEDFYKKM